MEVHKMVEWKDTSRYSRDDKERIPNAWSATIGYVDVMMHRHIHYSKDTWLMTSRFLQIEQRTLKEKDDELARREAVEHIRAEMVQLMARLTSSFEVLLK
jgi:hypothetical protein